MSRNGPHPIFYKLMRAGLMLALALIGPLSHAQDAHDVAVGVDLPTVDRMSTDEQDKMLAALHAAGVHVIRTWITDDASYEFVRKAFTLGIKADLTVPFQYRADSQKRRKADDLPSIYPNYPLSAVDPEKTGAVFKAQLNKLEAMGIDFSAFEVGNEQNNPMFNGEFPIYPKNGCANCGNRGLDFLRHDPEGQQIAAGYRNYIKILAAIKEVRDHSRLNRQTPVILGGLSDNGAEVAWPGARTNQVSIKATIQYLRENGLDKVVDAYGIHTYPWANGPGQAGPEHNRQKRLEDYALSECQVAGRGKPCWITEWGVQDKDDSCPPKEGDRALLIRELMTDDFRPYVQQKRVLGLLYWLWQSEAGAKSVEPHTIYRCGTLTESGHLAIEAALLR